MMLAPRELREMQFEILPTDTAVQGVPFGIGLDVSVDDGGFIPGGSEWSTQDAENPTRGTTAFGRDRLTGPVWTWQLHTNRGDTLGAVESLGEIATAWRMEEIREKPGAVLAIRYRLGGRVRRVYGRPRRFDAPPTNRILDGYVPISATFKCVDGYTYSDVEDSVVLSLTGGSLGGFTFPAIFPVTTAPVGLQARQAVVGGDAHTYPVIRFDGPVIDPHLETDLWNLTLNGVSLNHNEYAVVDTRPWALSALKNGSQSIAGNLGRRQWLSKMSLPPGAHAMRFRGISPTSAATCTVRWASCWNSI